MGTVLVALLLPWLILPHPSELLSCIFLHTCIAKLWDMVCS